MADTYILTHSLAATEVAQAAQAALVVEGFTVVLDMDPGRDVLGGSPLTLDGPDGDDFDRVAEIIAVAIGRAKAIR